MTVEQADEHDPQSSLWIAVAELEKKGFTRREIFDALKNIAENLRPKGGFKR